jgi:hypothetical protein
MPRHDEEALDWDALAAASVRRRAEIGLTQEQAGQQNDEISSATIRIIESTGKDSYSARTLIGLAKSLRWPLDGPDRILAGENPMNLATENREPAVLELSARIGALPPEKRARLEAYLDGLLESF